MADSVVQTDYFLVLSLVVWQVHFSGLKHELPENCVKWLSECVYCVSTSVKTTLLRK